MAAPATVRIAVQGCDGKTGTGSGVFIAKDRVLTAAHVVDEAQTIVLQSDDVQTYGRVVRTDPANDVAVVAVQDAFSGDVPEIADYEVDQGAEVRALGYPNSVTKRWVSEGIVATNDGELLDQNGEVIQSGMLAVTAPLNPGNSGGPVIDLKGNVIGIVSAKNSWSSDDRPTEGMAFAVHGHKIRSEVLDWLTLEPRGSSCRFTQLSYEDLPARFEDRELSEDEKPVVTSLMLHGGAINAEAYQIAWQLFTPAMRKRMGSLEGWSAGLTSSVWESITVHDLTVEGDTAQAEATLETHQLAEYGRHGQTCSTWDMSYRLRFSDDYWHIDRATAADDSPTAC